MICWFSSSPSTSRSIPATSGVAGGTGSASRAIALPRCSSIHSSIHAHLHPIALVPQQLSNSNNIVPHPTRQVNIATTGFAHGEATPGPRAGGSPAGHLPASYRRTLTLKRSATEHGERKAGHHGRSRTRRRRSGSPAGPRPPGPAHGAAVRGGGGGRIAALGVQRHGQRARGERQHRGGERYRGGRPGPH